MLENREAPVVVVGAGASGVLSTIALLRAGHSVVLVERDRCWSTGPAYATSDERHLLNVPAGKLSADAASTGDFVEWASHRHADVTGDSFLPRRTYGAYLRDCLDRAAAHARRGALRRVSGEVVALDLDTPFARCRAVLGDRRGIEAAHVVLALGNPPSARLSCIGDGVVEDPWAFCVRVRPGPRDTVMLVGSGLTAVDVALSLAGRRHEGPIHMVSRHGRLPRAHAACAPRPVPVQLAPVHRATELVAWLRAEIAAADGDWRSVFDGLRSSTNDLWAAMPECERVRLLRHGARYWEMHRHRMAPQVASNIATLIAGGRLTVDRGTVIGVERGRDERPRAVVRTGTGVASRRADWVVNCTGPQFDLRRSSVPLVRSLFERGSARRGPAGLGLDVTADGALIARDGSPAPDVSVVGPLRRGAEWETTAIPEIRSQADALARRAELVGDSVHALAV